MHITDQKLSFDIFTVENVQNIFMEHYLYLKYPNDFCHKTKINNFDPYNVLLSIAVLLMTAFVLQGHILLQFLPHFSRV